MANKEDGNYRPHYLAIQDSQNPGIYWMVPVKCGGWDAAFLIQNAFPTTADYFDHIHTSKGIPLSLHSSTAKLIADNLSCNIRLHKRGIPLFYTETEMLASCSAGTVSPVFV